ncbi:hypothetical protein RCL1_004506 [Eukaryota sp. TZLM3-RCL]
MDCSEQYQGLIEELTSVVDVLLPSQLSDELTASLSRFVSSENQLNKLKSNINTLGLELQRSDVFLQKNPPSYDSSLDTSISSLNNFLSRFSFQ